jgi:hypothetical protein
VDLKKNDLKIFLKSECLKSELLKSEFLKSEFRNPNSRNPVVPCSDHGELDLSPWTEKRRDKELRTKVRIEGPTLKKATL